LERDEGVKFLATRRAAVLAVAVVTEAAGLALVALPATATTTTHHGTITVTAGGDRTSSSGVAGTVGVRFTEQHANPGSCTTGSHGTCSFSVPTGDHRVTQAGAPAGWFRSPQLGISPDSHRPTC
jgi:hypothetical protein